jgi:hypothetical protein
VHRNLIIVATFLAACGGGSNQEPTSVSAKARVMAKGGKVWGTDLANGLGLQAWDLCAELGTYDCLEDAHLVTLGGVDAANLGIDDPLPNASVSAPIAADRVAIAACAERYDRDVEGPAVVFGPVLKGDTAGHREDVAKNLVQRLLGREPNDAEVDSLLALHDTLGSVSADLARDWSIGACVVVATSTEALFY